jgi:hypothetical protein
MFFFEQYCCSIFYIHGNRVQGKNRKGNLIKGIRAGSAHKSKPSLADGEAWKIDIELGEH